MKREKVVNKQFNSRFCYVCGMENPSGFHAHFYETENKKCFTIIEPNFFNQSYPSRMHGGIASTLLDETIGRAIQIDYPTLFGVTTNLEVKYIKPIPLDRKLTVVGYIETDTRLLFTGIGYILSDTNVILAKATGKYMKMDVNKIADNFDHRDWFYVDEKLPEFIELPEDI